MGVSCEFTRIARVGIVSDKQTSSEKDNPTKIFHSSVEIHLKLHKSSQTIIQDTFAFTLNYFQKHPCKITCPHFEITQWTKLVTFLENHFSETEISTALSEPKFVMKSELKDRLVVINKTQYFKSK
ncbi:hypothetical protein EHQ68_06810 [Leptospira congkakensis]|uniref:Uncharacterized protein n=1 Tax=Leptospira congkakensis TaxID=2484932 RepID=A0A4Z1A399_9LEPT|nr:hypothetical protein EHQ69_16350 [Leptospira congkakensis]TGL89892.1 hypothetical protein EHQ68_06810 [Leptospira congkakensis]TGL96118.1 hypothetical protein EHQ70_12020 [Leptospira congkakensis]